MTFPKGRCLAQALMMFYKGQELNSCPQTVLGVRMKQRLKGNKIYFFETNTWDLLLCI